MDFFESTCYFLIEMVKVGNQFDKAKVDEGIFTTEDITIFLYFALIALNLVLKLRHNVFNIAIEVICELFIHKILGTFVNFSNLIIKQSYIFQVSLIESMDLMLFLCVVKITFMRAYGFFINTLQPGQGITDEILFLLSFEVHYQMCQCRQRCQTLGKVIDIQKKIVRDIQLGQASEATHIFWQILEPVPMQGKGFEILKFTEQWHHGFQCIYLSNYLYREYLNSREITFLPGSTCCSSLRSFIFLCNITVTFVLYLVYNFHIYYMKVRSILAGLIIFVFLASVTVLKFLKFSFVSSLEYDGKAIQIKRGDYNIPEIHAQTHRGALFAWGYVTAQDRLFQLAFRRESVRGRLSKYLGEKAIEVDKWFRQINLYGWAVKCAERFEKENATQYGKFKAYAEGINAYYHSLTFRPLQFYLIGLQWEQWTVTDMFALYKIMKWSLSFGMVDEYVRSALLGKYTKEEIDQFLPYQKQNWMHGDFSTLETIIKDDQIPEIITKKSTKDLSDHFFKPIQVSQMLDMGFFEYLDVNERASNSWAISGKYTDSGHALLSNDPHLDSVLPAEWHQVKVFYKNSKGQQVYIIGAALVGTPLVIGKFPYMTISITVNYIDSLDLFKEKVEGEKYLLDGEWKPLKSRKQIIEIKNSDPVEYTVHETHRGPIIRHMVFKGHIYKMTQPISVCWIGYTDAEYTSLVPYIHLAEVTSFQQILPLLKKYTDYSPSFSLIYITKDDHIGYHAMGMLPLRRDPHSGVYVKDGSLSENDWIGFVQGENKLHCEDPARGYIVSANNKAASRKYFDGVGDMAIYTARADRIQKMIRDQISSGRKLTKDFMRKIQLDTVDVNCLELVAGMKKKIASENPNYKFIYSIFENFDCDFHSQSTTASFYLTFLQNLYEQIHPEGYNSTFNLANLHSYYQYMYKFMLKEHTEEDFKKLNNSMFDALRELRTFFKSENPSTYKYGQIHKDHMIHRPFSYSEHLKSWFEHTSPGFGNLNTPNVAIMTKFHEKDYRTNHRANLRLIMSYYQDSEWIIDGGSSEKFYSRNYKDQTGIFLSGKYILMDAWNRTNPVY